ncbi:MAG: S8 family serine peptidase [Candidatus Zixiibacteriota bacterium]
MKYIKFVQRAAAVVILLSIFGLSGRASDEAPSVPPVMKSECTEDPFYAPGVLLLTADQSLIAMPAGYSRLEFQFDAPQESGEKHNLEDYIIRAVIDGDTISPVSAEYLEGVGFDNALFTMFEQYRIDAVIRRIGGWVPGDIETGLFGASYDLSQYYELRFPETLSVEYLEAVLEEFIVPDDVMPRAFPVSDSPIDPNPPLQQSPCSWWDDSTEAQWQLDYCGVFDAWEMTCPLAGDSVVVAIIDKGFGLPPSVHPSQGFHPDILPNIHDKSRVNWDFGYTSDHGTSVIGAGFAAENNGLPPLPYLNCKKPTDATISSGYGIIGVAPHAEVIALSYEDEDGSDYCQDFQYVLDSCPEVRIISFSWGIRGKDCIFEPHPDPLLIVQVEIAFKNGILLFASSGHSDAQCASPFLQYPAMSPFVHAVGATNKGGERWVYGWEGSNYHGSGYVELAAPGDSILVPGAPLFKPPQIRDSSMHYFHRVSGTSVATPQAAAVAALIMSAYPDIGAETVFDIIARTTQEEYDVPDIYKGYGIIQADKALRYIEEVGLYCDTINGDVDANGFVNFDDICYLREWIFGVGPAPVVVDTIGADIVYPLADANGDCVIDVGDIEYLVYYLYGEGSAPVAYCANAGQYSAEIGAGDFHLSNAPNPFNPATHIRYRLSAEMAVRLDIFNILGQVVATLVDETQEAGAHTAVWDGRDASGRMAASGIYIYRLSANGHSQSRKMALMK